MTPCFTADCNPSVDIAGYSRLTERDQVGTLARLRACRVFRSRFLDYAGVYMMHCHMMNHEEMGMMQTVEVYKE
jgi:hypothetical protein